MEMSVLATAPLDVVKMKGDIDILDSKKEAGTLTYGDQVISLRVEHVLALLLGKIIRWKDHGGYSYVIEYRKPEGK